MNKYTIKEIGRLGLGYKTFITNIRRGSAKSFDFETKMGDASDGLDIYLWANDRSHRWTVASFELNPKEKCFELQEVGNRLTDREIDYAALRELIALGHDILAKVEIELD